MATWWISGQHCCLHNSQSDSLLQVLQFPAIVQKHAGLAQSQIAFHIIDIHVYMCPVMDWWPVIALFVPDRLIVKSMQSVLKSFFLHIRTVSDE